MSASELFMDSLRGFVPPRVFDVHAHLYREEDFAGVSEREHPGFPRLGTYDAWRCNTHEHLG